jgi:hypothetical protein
MLSGLLSESRSAFLRLNQLGTSAYSPYSMENPPPAGTEPSSPAKLLLPKRIGRLSFLIRLIAVLILHFAVGSLIQHLPLAPEIRAVLLAVWVMVLLVYYYIFVIIPRVRDFGLPALAALLCLIPLFNILLLMALLFGPKNHWQTLQDRHK